MGGQECSISLTSVSCYGRREKEGGERILISLSGFTPSVSFCGKYFGLFVASKLGISTLKITISKGEYSGLPVIGPCLVQRH